MLKEQKIILISDSRLVRSILKRAFQLSHQFQVVAEVADLAGFGTALDQAQAGWVLLAQPLQADIPEEINQALKDRPDVGLLVVATDSNRVLSESVVGHPLVGQIFLAVIKSSQTGLTGATFCDPIAVRDGGER